MNPLWLVPIIILLAYEALAKGWYFFILGPLLIVLVPILAITMIATKRLRREQPDVWSLRLEIAQIVGILAWYIFSVGFGDTDTTFLFGFYPSTIDSALSSTSSVVLIVGMLVGGAATVALIVYLLLAFRRLKQNRAISEAEAQN